MMGLIFLVVLIIPMLVGAGMAGSEMANEDFKPAQYSRRRKLFGQILSLSCFLLMTLYILYNYTHFFSAYT